MDLRQSTASQEISLGQFLDSTDGDTEEGGLTIANTDIKLRKGGTITLASKNSGGATVISNGVYSAVLDATDTNTLGILEIYVHVAGALATKSTYNVLTATAYDAKYTGTYNNFDPAADTVATVTTLTNQAGVIATGTAQAATGTTIQLASGETFADDEILGATVVVTGGTTGVGQSRLITDYVSSTDTATVDAWTTTPTGTITYEVIATPPASTTDPVDVNVTQILGTAITETSGGRVANNFDFFYDNADAQTAKTVDDVGVAGSSLTQQNVADAMKLTPTAGAPATGSVNEHLDDILTDTGTTIPASITALNDVAATDIVSAGAITTLSGAVVNVDLVDTNTDMRGTDSAATAANLATVDSNVDAILVDTGTTLPAQITGLNDISVSDILTTQMSESYAADAVAPTLAQALFLIQQTVGDFSITGTTITTKQLDGSTTAATYTLDDGTSPTSRTRAT